MITDYKKCTLPILNLILTDNLNTKYSNKLINNLLFYYLNKMYCLFY